MGQSKAPADSSWTMVSDAPSYDELQSDYTEGLIFMHKLRQRVEKVETELAAMTERAEKAEAERDAIRGAIEAVTMWDGSDPAPPVELVPYGNELLEMALAGQAQFNAIRAATVGACVDVVTARMRQGCRTKDAIQTISELREHIRALADNRVRVVEWNVEDDGSGYSSVDIDEIGIADGQRVHVVITEDA